MNNNPTIDRLSERFPDEMIECEKGQRESVAVVKKDKILKICQFLRDDQELLYDFLIDLCGVDYQGMGKHARFAVVYHLFSLEKGYRIRLKVPLEETDINIDTVVEVWKGAEWFERETYDLFGIIFNNHPFLRRILTHHQFIGHPLRKDYPVTKRQPCTEIWDMEL
jgi:NADH-quinone oxidoreductase subunit C